MGSELSMADGNITVEVSTQAAHAELERLRDLLTQALALRDAPKWPLPGCDDTAKASEKWWRAVVAALGPNAAHERTATDEN